MSEPTTAAGLEMLTGMATAGATQPRWPLTLRWSKRMVLAIESEAHEAGVREERARIEEHQPDIGGDISDSTWLTCHCGWDSSDSKLSWWEHITPDDPA